MKQQWILKIFGVTLALLCLSCSGFFEIEGKENIEAREDPNAQPTRVVFSNQNNKYSVGVFSTPSRDTNIISVSGNQTSNPLSWVATNSDGYNFYFTYYFSVEGGRIPYVPPSNSNASYVNMIINEGKTTTVQIPTLSNYLSQTDRLSNDIWLAIKNNGTSTLRLVSGNSFIPHENNDATVNPGTTALYKIPAGINLSSCIIRMGATDASLPVVTYDYEQGNLYVVDFNGLTATLREEKELTLGNL